MVICGLRTRGAVFGFGALVAALGFVGVDASLRPWFERLRWRRLSVSAGSAVAPGRRDHACGYSAAYDSLVVFGGRGAGLLRDTWIFDPANGSWLDVSDASTAPPARFSLVSGVHAGHSDAAQLWVTTGEGEGRVFFNDAWRWDWATHAWTAVSTAGEPPSERYGAVGGILDDPTLPASGARLLVSHGFAHERFWDTRALDLATGRWEDASPSSEDPAHRPFARCIGGGAVLAPGPDGSNRALTLAIFGGCGSGGHGPCAAHDAWTLQNAQWTESEGVCAGPRVFGAVARWPVSEDGARVDVGNASWVVLAGGAGGIHGNGDAGEVSLWNVATGAWHRLRVQGRQLDEAEDADDHGGGHGGHGGGGGAGSSRSPVPGPQAGIQLASGRAGVFWVGSNDAGMEIFHLELLSEADDAADAEGRAESLPCPSPLDIRLIHGLLMLIGWGVLIPLGVTMARFGRAFRPPLWFTVHRIVNTLGLLVQLGGFIASFYVNVTAKFLAVPHVILGLAAFVFGMQQPLNALLRPHPPENKTRARRCWEWWHKNSGRLATVLGLVNPFLGLYYLATKQRARSPGFILYALWVAGLVIAWVVLTLRAPKASTESPPSSPEPKSSQAENRDRSREEKAVELAETKVA